MKARSATRRAAYTLAVTVCVVGISGVASAAPLESLFMSMEATPLFDVDAGAQGEWDIPAALNARNGTALDTSFNLFSIADLGLGDPAGTLNWTGNPLTNDTSVGTLASAEFGPGGTFSLSGKLWKNFAPVFNGVLITGTVSGFDVEEQSLGDNFLDLVVNSTPKLTPTGGVLADGTFASMPTDYFLSITGAEVMQGGGPLEDFQSDIQMIGVVLFTLTPVPEPGSLALLTGLMLFAGRRRR